jgi:hypothetical protein
MNCFLSTVASARDSVVLPAAQPGMQVTVIMKSEGGELVEVCRLFKPTDGSPAREMERGLLVSLGVPSRRGS